MQPQTTVSMVLYNKQNSGCIWPGVYAVLLSFVIPLIEEHKPWHVSLNQTAFDQWFHRYDAIIGNWHCV